MNKNVLESETLYIIGISGALALRKPMKALDELLIAKSTVVSAFRGTDIQGLSHLAADRRDTFSIRCNVIAYALTSRSSFFPVFIIFPTSLVCLFWFFRCQGKRSRGEGINKGL